MFCLQVWTVRLEIISLANETERLGWREKLGEVLCEKTLYICEVMNKEGDAREAVGMLCQSDLRRRLERHLVKQGGSTASAHLQGGWDGLDREGIVSQRGQQGLRALQ